jgi:ATP-binding cassette subfamily B multidrug efflux pump
MILKYLTKRDWTLVIASVALVCVQVWLDLEIPGYMSSITMLMQTGGTVDQVLNEGYKMVACALGSLLSSIIVGYFAAVVAASLSKKLRELEFQHVESYSMEDIGKFSIASLITRSTNDITQVQTTVAMGLQVMIKAPITAVWAITKILGKGEEWTIATAVAVIVMMAVIIVLMRFVVPRFKKIQWQTDNLNRVTDENLTGLRVVRAYNAESYQEKKFDDANAELTGNNLFTTRAMGIMMPTISAVMNFLSLSIYWIGAYLIMDAGSIADKMTLFSNMIVFSSYAMQVILSFMMLVVIFMVLPRATVAAHRIEEVIDTDTKITDGKIDSAPEGSPQGEVSFQHVSFKYPGAEEYVLRDVSFDVKKGETVAFIGSTGSGKSTLINLVPRFYDVTDGKVLVDGIDVRDYTQEALHSKLGYVPQKAVMFAGTVTSNVNYGNTSNERTADDVKRAIAIAQGTDFVERMENGYEGQIAQGGTNVSGGQKQRLSIARAVCRGPEIYLFDDTFSALDYKTDRLLRDSLKKETAGVTSLIVAQRIGTIMNADKIVVLDEGRMVGIGKHDELLKNCEVYREIAYSQLSEEELSR